MMMNEYYLVPVTTKAVKFEETSLMEMLSVVGLDLYMLEEYKMELKYGSDDLSTEEMLVHEREAEKLADKIATIFKIRNLPEKLIIVKDEEGFHELATELPVTAVSESFFNVFKITSEEVIEEFLDNESYSRNATNFFNSFAFKDKTQESNGQKKKAK